MTSASDDAPGVLDVVVVGSINHDLGIGVDRTPGPGETVLGDDARWAPGGKGANQAVGCARLGLRVAMVGAVGDDAAGTAMRSALATEGVDTDHLARVAAPTGLAVVLVDRTGESTIVVSPGANGHVTPTSVDASAQLLGTARAVLCQLEVPVATVERAAQLTTGWFVLNPAPGRRLPASLLASVDVLLPNRHELGVLVGEPTPHTIAEVERLARRVGAAGAVVVTLGADGALVLDQGTATHVRASVVQSVDTTGAGDSFCAAVTAGLLAGDGILSAARAAVRVAAVTTLRPGALAAMPSRAEVDALLGEDHLDA